MAAKLFDKIMTQTLFGGYKSRK